MSDHPAPRTGPGAPTLGDVQGEGAGPGAGTRDGVPDLGWPVGTVAERLGIAAPTLRSWDRRHGVGPSLRTSGNHRRYTAVDIRRVELMSRLTAQGVPAQSAADSVLALDAAALRSTGWGGAADAGELEAAPFLEAPHGAAEGPGTGPVIGSDVGFGHDTDLVEAIVGAARTLDAKTLAEIYRHVLRRRGVGRAWVEVFAPALSRVGDLWQDGQLGVQSEHLTSELLQSELRAVARANRLRVAGRPVVLASADDEQHHLPLLALEAELSRGGVPGLFLGPRVPSEALLSTLIESRPRALFLWASLPRTPDERLWRDLAAVDWPLEVVIGGPGWPDDVTVPDGPVSLTRVADFTSALRALLGSPDGLNR